MNKELTPLEALENIWVFVQAFCENATSLSKHNKELRIIENALKNYEKPTSKPIILCGRTHGHTQAIIDTICKNYKEVKITNLEDENKLKALNEILALHDKWLGNEMSDFEFFTLLNEARDKYGLLELD